MSKGGRTGTTWGNGWNSGNTTPIRVPIALKDNILAYARAVDENDVVPLSAGDFLQIIDRYIAWRTKNYRSTQQSREPDITAPTWDELRKLRKLLRESPELLN
ncbi:hypothetical protein [Nostoc sp. WHI]|uniref:hypothetical protein n=1 Tax=Nostoc sp. WHI TaxID=2650611 RepID=UPI0018C4EA42|nr:hypothetical protein [Nostoc sp. WHI]MBG1271759.1 hypothetical protein [Nostoc sp. WHI]